MACSSCAAPTTSFSAFRALATRTTCSARTNSERRKALLPRSDPRFATAHAGNARCVVAHGAVALLDVRRVELGRAQETRSPGAANEQSRARGDDERGAI